MTETLFANRGTVNEMQSSNLTCETGVNDYSQRHYMKLSADSPGIWGACIIEQMKRKK